jgi:hypothetical protein
MAMAQAAPNKAAGTAEPQQQQNPEPQGSAALLWGSINLQVHWLVGVEQGCALGLLLLLLLLHHYSARCCCGGQ